MEKTARTTTTTGAISPPPGSWPTTTQYDAERGDIMADDDEEIVEARSHRPADSREELVGSPAPGA